MKLHDIAFYIAIFFIIGIFIASVTALSGPRIFITGAAAAVLAAIFYFLDKKYLSVLAAAILAGGIYLKLRGVPIFLRR